MTTTVCVASWADVYVWMIHVYIANILKNVTVSYIIADPTVLWELVGLG